MQGTDREVTRTARTGLRVGYSHADGKQGRDQASARLAGS
ncbi:hypothetical protein CS0771_17530 [Catellatospora sp. IY07-71]|nr:hypothetical protein CS0771_17530 [Catellatospora sp. IY07-71]